MSIRFLTLLGSLIFVAACSDRGNSRGPTAPSTHDGPVTPTATNRDTGALLSVPSSHDEFGPFAAFPPRNEPFAFRQALELKYRDGLRRLPVSTYVDNEGSLVWTTEYLRYRVSNCSHVAATQFVLAQIDGGGIAPDCGGSAPFPPRNEPFDFRANTLESKYRDGLRRQPIQTHVDIEGEIVWEQEYLRYRVSGSCGHIEAQDKVFRQIDGQGIQPICGPRTEFGAGQYLVGRDIVPGRYYADPPRSGCYWERQRGLGGTLSDIIANEFVGYDAGQWIVDILPTDLAFETDAECGTWFNSPRRGLQANITPGLWLVGPQVIPGTYRAFTLPGCYWARVRGFTGNLSDIIANDFNAAGGSALVSISFGDVGFESDDQCTVWTRIGAITDSIDDPGSLKPQQSVEDVERNWELKRRELAGRR
jgi:hypothetical protein